MSSSGSLPYILKPHDARALLLNHTANSSSDTPTTITRTIPLCGSWFMPNSPHTGRTTFQARRLPRARFLDLDACSDVASPYPHMLPSPQHFARYMTKLGIRRGDRLVVYDAQETGLFSAPRVAWMLRVFGHERVHVLDNFREWVRLGFETESGEVEEEEEEDASASASTDVYAVPEMRRDMVIDFEEVHALLETGRVGSEPGQTRILDARPHPRFTGAAPEPRPQLSSGHMPGSTSVAFGELLDPETKTLLPREQLRALFESKGITKSGGGGEAGPIISSCGSGVTAAVVDLALGEVAKAMGEEKVGERRIYDGSWSEWASRAKDMPGMIVKDDV